MKGKRLLAMLLAVMMIVTALPVGIFAEEETVENGLPESIALLAEQEPVDLNETILDLYWSKFHGLDGDGNPEYSLSDVDNFMWDEIGQDINAVFLLGDGINFTEVPFEELKFPEGLNYSRNAEYSNAVYMKFDTTLVGNITYTKDNVTYEFPLEVEAPVEEELEAGLYWCWVEEAENGDLFANQDDGYENELQAIENDDYELAFFYVDEDGEAVPIAMEDLVFPDFVSTKQMKSGNAYFVDFTFNKPGTGMITCANYPNSTIEVTCLKRQLGYYDAFPAQEQNRLGDVEGVIEGHVGETVTAYLAWDTAETGPVEEIVVGRFHYAGQAYLIKNTEMSEAAEILSENGITLTLNQNDGYVKVEAVISENSMNLRLNVAFESGYSELMWLSIDPEKGSSGEEEEDQPSFTKGPGLYWYNFNGMKNGEPVYDYSDVDTAMWDEPGQEIEAVFVLWDGETAVEIAPDQLTFPEELKWKVSEDYPNAVCMEFDTVMDAVISCNGYEFQIVIALPDVGFYSEPQRTEENLVTTGLTYTGKDKDENDKNCTVYYILSNGEETFTDIEVMMGDAEANANEVRVVLSDDGMSGLLYLYEELQFGERYKVNLYRNGARLWGRGFNVRDQQPGLYYCSRGDAKDVLEGNIESLRSNLQMEINGTYARALFFVDGDKVILLDDTADLDFDKYGEAEWDAEENCFMICMTKLGNYEITYTHSDGVEYTLPVTVTLPAFGLYSENSASKETYLGEEILFAGDPTVVYLVCSEQGSKITGLKPDARDEGADMRFLTYSIDPQGQYIKLEIGEDVLSEKEYTMEVYFKDEANQEQDDRVSFTVVKRDPALLWFPVEEDEDGGYEVIDSDNGNRKLTCQPGDSVLLQIRWFDGAQHTVLDLADVEVPAFMTAESVSDGVLRLTCNGLGIGEVTSDLCPGWTIKVTAQTADALGFYTDPERKPAYADSDFNGDDGDVITRYLMWDQTLLPDVDKVTVTLNDGEGNGNVLVDADVTTTDLSRYGIQLTPDLQNGWVKVDATITDWRNVTFKAWQNGASAASVNVNIDEDYELWGRGSSVLNLDYDTGVGNIPLTFSMGSFDHDRVTLDGFGGSGFSETTGDAQSSMDQELIIGVLAYEGENEEDDAPPAAYAAISDVSFYIRKYVNQDGSGDQSECNIRLSDVYITKYNGMDVYAVRMMADPGQYARVQVGATFTVTLNGQKYTHSVHHRYGFKPTSEFYIDMDELDTAEKLNDVFGSRDGLMNWIEENDPATYNAIRALLAQEEFIALEMTLPAVRYDDVIHYSAVIEDGFHGRIELYGSEDKQGNRTTFPGLRTEDNDFFFLHGIDFVADPDIKQSYGEKRFTCGIMMYGKVNSDIYNVQDCTFTGFDYGIYNTEKGYTVCRRCVFTDCAVAYLLDCADKRNGNGNSDMEDCRFVNCETAIRIKGLPQTHTPYNYRIHNCDFIGNEIDIDVSQEGRFYFIENYYGDPKHENDPVKEAGDVHKRPPRVRGRGYADVVVNPRWRDPVTLDGSNHSSNHLIVDTKHGLANYMFNDDALGWSFDSSILNTDLSNQNEGVSLAMTNDEEETIGTWNLEGGAAQTQLLSLFADEPVADTFCPALDIHEMADGSIKVTVDDSVLFSQRKVTLTIPCEFVLAAVTQNGSAVEAFTANGQVTFTVTAGGAYVISEALTEEVMEESFKTGGAPETNEGETVPEAEVEIGWFDFNAQDVTEDASFVQIGTSTQQTVQQVNPDAENLGDAEDAIVETEVITVQAVYQAPVTAEPDEEIQITVLLVLYDSNGRMIAMKEQAAQQNEGTKVITVECDASLIGTDAVQVRAFVISADGKMSPLAPVPFSQTLEIPQ